MHFSKLGKDFQSGQGSGTNWIFLIFTKSHNHTVWLIRTNSLSRNQLDYPSKGIQRYNESHFHYDGYTFQLEDEFTLVNLSNMNTFPIHGLYYHTKTLSS